MILAVALVVWAVASIASILVALGIIQVSERPSIEQILAVNGLVTSVLLAAVGFYFGGEDK